MGWTPAGRQITRLAYLDVAERPSPCGPMGGMESCFPLSAAARLVPYGSSSDYNDYDDIV
jgi:hypothetical protein